MVSRLAPLAGGLFVFALIHATTLSAAPLRPDLVDPLRPDLTVRGDPVLPKPAWVDLPPAVRLGGHRGTHQILIICIEFTDQAGSQSTASFSNMVFGPWSPASVSDYYQEVSYGNLSLSGGSVGWYTSANARSYYGNLQRGFGSWPNNAAALAAEAIAAADAAGADFSQYDNDNDGTAESVFIVHSGEGYETSADLDDIQSHYSRLSLMGDPSAPYTYDGKQVDPYLSVAELGSTTPLTHVEIGVWCHEYGHMLGLPDLYDAGSQCTGINSHGIGVWGGMSYGCWGWNVQTPERPTHLTAWSKIRMGWLAPTVVSSALLGQTLSPIETTPVALKIGMDTRPTEYFLLSYRDNTSGFDQGLPGTGLCIWHVDDEITSGNDCEQGGSCTSSTHYLVALEQPDGAYHLDCGTTSNYGDAGDVYPYGGNTSFATSTTPSSDRYVGSPSGTSVTNIAMGSGVVTMDITPGTLYEYLVYDDATCELGLSWGTPGWGFALRATPTVYPFQLQGLYAFSQDLFSPDFQSQVWDDSGPGGTPGAPLSSVHTTTGALGLSWNYEDYSADDVTITSGDLWLVFIEYGTCKMGCDTSSPWNGRTMYYYSGIFAADNGLYGNYMLRATGIQHPATDVADLGSAPGTPLQLSLGQPNPFRSSTTLLLNLPSPGRVTAEVFDLRGRRVGRLLDGVLPARQQIISWDGRDEAGQTLASGVYFVHLRALGETFTRKVVIVR